MDQAAQKPRSLWHFNGGLHLPGHKATSTQHPIRQATLPRELVLPLQQHIGEPAEPAVEVGDRVLKGQVVGRAGGYVSVPVHASSSGTVSAIEDRPVPHPSGLSAPCVVIEPDGEDRHVERSEAPIDHENMDPSALRNRIREAGIVGLGGAGFPAFIKLNPGTHKPVDLLVLNGAECEPYITCDDMLMRERAREIIDGLRIMRHALQAKASVIGIEDNKPEAYEALSTAATDAGDDGVEVVQVPTIYPTGGEKQLIKVLTGQEVPSNGLPLDIGIVCHNVATAAAVHRALQHHEPLTSRIVTVTGGGVGEHTNFRVAIGTPMGELIEQCGGYTDNAKRLVMGGPMMGFTLTTDQIPVIKTTNCILVADESEAPEPQPAIPCIRCGACAEVCPAVLLPQQLYWHARAKDFDKVQDYHLFDCIECGCCAYVCPSHIPLVQYFRFAKTEIWAQEREKQKADLARRRHEFHLERLEREKAEREERMRQKKAALEKSKDKEAGAEEKDSKKAAIDAALKRVEKKKAQANHTAPDTNNEAEQQERKAKQAEQRRKPKDQATESDEAKVDDSRD